MHLTQLKLRNFRGFYGNHTIEFAQPGQRPVTLIHGENGAGKTNLLNAIYWCVTGQLTPRLSNPDLLFNKTARDEDRSDECFVDLAFVHDGREYRAIRTVTGAKQSTLSLYRVDEKEHQIVHAEKAILERIVPKALARWFFFDAEAIGELELTGSSELKASLRRILGFELVDGLISDLSECLNKKQRALANLVKSKELEELQTRIDAINHVLPAQQTKLASLKREQETLEKEIGTLDMRLRELPQSRPLHERRTKLDASRKVKHSDLKESKQRFVQFIGETAPALLLSKSSAELDKQLYIKENTGRLPAPYSEQLVEDILRDSACICGRPVATGTVEETKIRGLLRNASTTSFNTRIRAIQFLIKDIQATARENDARKDTFTHAIRKLDEEIASIDQELRDINGQLKSIDEESIQKIEEDLSAAKARARAVSKEHDILEQRIKDNKESILQTQATYVRIPRLLGH